MRLTPADLGRLQRFLADLADLVPADPELRLPLVLAGTVAGHASTDEAGAWGIDLSTGKDSP